VPVDPSAYFPADYQWADTVERLLLAAEQRNGIDRLFSEPHRPILLLQHERHPVVDRCKQGIRRDGDDAVAAGGVTVRPPEGLPKSGERHRATIDARDGEALARAGVALSFEVRIYLAEI
jgi:hypothetical protein